MKRIHRTNSFPIASSLVLLAIFLFLSHSAFAQMPKLFLKFVEKQNNVQSGYVKLQKIDPIDNDTFMRLQTGFFISTPKDLKYLVWNQRPKQHPNHLDISCKSAHTIVDVILDIMNGYIEYRYDNEIYNAKGYDYYFYYPTANGISVNDWENHLFQRIPPKIDKKNIRYKILYPDQEEDLLTNISREMEFERKTFNLIQEEFSLTYDKIGQMSHRIDILEQRLYNYIHPDILDTISFKFDELKKGYDRQFAEEQAKKDSAFKAHFCDSIVQLVTKTGGTWVENMPQEQDVPQEVLFFMPEWKFPLLSGDTIYSDSIHSQFLLIDMWYISCHPCRMAMRELASIDTLYDESLLKMVSINVSDTDTAKMRQVVENLNLKSDIACAFKSNTISDMSKKMGICRGYPQLYLVDMKTKQVIWRSCGWRQGFTKEIEEIIKEKN